MFTCPIDGGSPRTRLSRRLRVLAAAATVGLGAALCATAIAPAAAGTQRDVIVAGTYTATDLGTTECVPLSDTRLHCTTSGFASAYRGGLVGSSTASFEQVIDCATGRTNGTGVETFSGSVRGGPTTTLRWRLYFSADFDCGTFFPSRLRIIGIVTNGPLHGVLFFDDTTYRGVLAG
jgi:hypothetical protein